jgi:hypothetical protein
MEESPDATRPQPKGSPSPDAAAMPAQETRSDGSHSRRRLLTRSLIGGPLALAAMRPVKTLASSSYCNYSGWHSFKLDANTSQAPKTKCTTGKKSGHYNTGSGWPATIASHTGTTVTLHATGGSATKFKNLFPGTDSTTLLTYLGGSANQGVFITALFNAKNVAGYPFTCAQIYAIWSNPALLGSGVTLAGAALFFSQLDVNA